MASNNRKALRRRPLQLEQMESRELLSAVASGLRPAVEMSHLKKTHAVLNVYGSLQGQGVQSPMNNNRGTFSFLAAGPEAPVGVGTFSGSAKYKTAREGHFIVGYDVLNGKGTLTNSTGERINLQFSGEIYESGPEYAFSWTGTVSGGTGQFKGAAGNVDMYGTYSTSTDQFVVLGYTLTLTHA